MTPLFRTVALPLLALAGAAIVPAAPAAAQATAQPATPFRITGFRSARFGMPMPELRQAIARDFPAAPADALTEVDNPTERTRVLLLRLPALEPGPGPATVSYVVSAADQRLTHANVVWQTGAAPSDAERNQIALAGVQLARYFREQAWKPDGAVTGIANGPNSILLFAGVDPQDALVEVVASGVPLSAGPGGASAPAPTGPALLRVGYSAKLARPGSPR
jgi:hypothetical protein